MDKSLLAAVGTAMLLLAPPASGADVDGSFAVKGAGQFKCDELVLARNEQNSLERTLFLGWLQGYFTAVNAYEPGTYDVMPWGPSALLEIIVANYCEDNPEELVFAAAQVAVEALRDSRLQIKSEQIEAGEDAAATRLYVDILQRAQAALAERGLYDGAVDGAYGPQTASAVAVFQEQEGLEATGVPDPSTLWALLRPLRNQPAN